MTNCNQDQTTSNVPSWDKIIDRYINLLRNSFDIDFIFNIITILFILLLPILVDSSLLIVMSVPIILCFFVYIRSYTNRISKFQLVNITPLPVFVFTLLNITTLNGALIVCVLNAIVVSTITIITLNICIDINN